MVITKSTGTTASENLLATLCEGTFLGFWSYSNAFRNQGGPKELCDLLVVCNNHVIIFSDKSCAFPDTGNPKLDWSRWLRKSIGDSARQVLGAERWIRQFPDRVYLDRKCEQRLPIEFPGVGACKFHRIIIASGAAGRCRQYRGGTGSLIVEPSIIGSAHHDLANCDVQPFVIGSVDADPGRLHVFDEFTLPLVLKELDTITDFLSYLEFKEELFRSGKIGRIEGEENLLAMFVSQFHYTDHWKGFMIEATDGAVLDIKGNGWDAYNESAWRKEKMEAFQWSYVWDRIIQEFATHAFGGTLVRQSAQSVAANEQIFRSMANEPRFARAYLASKMLERWSHFEKGRVAYRLVASPTQDDTLYVFVFVPNEFSSDEEYRQVRQEYLQQYCFLVHEKHRSYLRVVGIATDAGDEPYRTFDVVLVEGKEWTREMEDLAREIQTELGVTGEGPVHRIGENVDRPATTTFAKGPKLTKLHALMLKTRILGIF